MANKTIEAVLRLSSKLGSMRAFNQLSGKIDMVDKKAKAFNRRQMLMDRGVKNFHATLLRAAAPLAIAAATTASVRSFATIERRMSRIGVTAEASVSETEKALERVRGVADDIGAPIDQVVDGLDSLVASGKTLDEALALLPAVARTAQSADADFSDMATTADAISASFDIAAGSMERAFDIVAAGGKAGKFELKDMAAELPSLAPAFVALGYKGEEGLKHLVAALQTVRLETGTSGEAATSMMDVLTKMQSQTVTNNFKKFGVDIRKEMAAAKAAGEDTIDAFIRMSRQALKGDMSKLPQLFTDKQMLIGMRALINHTREFAGYMNGLGDATGTVDRDLRRFTSDATSKLDRLGNSWATLKQKIGEGLFDAGAGNVMDAAAEGMSKAQAIGKELDRQGMGWWQQRLWWANNGFDTEKQNGLAWRGGFRSAGDRKTIDAYGQYGKSRAAAHAEPPLPITPRDNSGMPIAGPIPRFRDGGFKPAADPVSEGPVPTPRPSDASRARVAFDRSFDAYQAALPYNPPTALPFAAGASPRDAERQSMAALRSDPNGVAEAIDEALAQGGERAGKAIEEAARRINEESERGGSVFARMLDGMGEKIGADMARSFKANLGSVNVNARVSGATVNPGRTMANAGGVGAQ